jgi:hypothetical protein
VACKRFIEEKRKHMTEAVDNINVDLEDVDFSDIETEDEESATVTTDETEGEDETPAETPTKAKKPAKLAKAAKVTKAAKAAPKKAAPAKAVKKTVAAPKAAAAKDAAEKAAPLKTRKVREARSAERIDPKTAKAEGLIKLDDKGRDLPFKTASMMRWVLEQCLEPGGAPEKMLEKEVVKLGYDYKFQRTVIVSGKSGDSSLRPYPSTHVWKTEIADGKIRVYDVKRVAFYRKMPRIGKDA